MTRTTLLVALAAFIGVVITGWAVLGMWTDMGVTMSLHGWIAYALGAGASLLLSGGLFWLLFYSARRGHDDLERPEDLDG